MDPKALESLLRRWGWWKRNCILSIGSTRTVEQGIKERMPFGDGCSGGGPPIEGLDGVKWLKASEDVEQLNSVFMQMLEHHRMEMALLQYAYVLEWSVKRIAAESRSSRATIKNRLTRAKTLIEAKLVQLRIS